MKQSIIFIYDKVRNIPCGDEKQSIRNKLIVHVPNKRLPKIMAIQGKGKEFRPDIGYGIFEFSLKEKELAKILDQLHCAFTIEKREKETIYETRFDGARVLFFFHYNKRGLDYLSIHTNELMMDEIEIGSKKYDEVLHVVKSFCQKRIIAFSYSYAEDKTMDEIFIDFKNIGLSIWFSASGEVSDISVCRLPVAL